MALAKGIEGMTGQDLQREIQRGGKFVVFPFCISLLVITFRRASDIHFIRHGESALAKGWPFLLISLFLGWWGIPWGFIWTPMTIYQTLNGGRDVTQEVVRALQLSGGG
jgi:hypothetical protein